MTNRYLFRGVGCYHYWFVILSVVEGSFNVV